jgi:hypothetical protein
MVHDHLIAKTFCLLLLTSCVKPVPRPIDVVTVPTNAMDAPPGNPGESKANTFINGIGGLAIPGDHGEVFDGPSGATSYPVMREQQLVYAQVMTRWKADGWVAEEEVFLAGGYRMYLVRETKRLYVSVTNMDNGITLITVTEKS